MNNRIAYEKLFSIKLKKQSLDTIRTTKPHYSCINKRYMKTILSIILLIFLTNCSTHSVKLGKKCTKLADDKTYEKSFVWIVNNETLNDFENKISKENCIENGEKL